MDGELAALASTHNTYIEHLELLSYNTSLYYGYQMEIYAPSISSFPWFANTIPTYLI